MRTTPTDPGPGKGGGSCLVAGPAAGGVGGRLSAPGIGRALGASPLVVPPPPSPRLRSLLLRCRLAKPSSTSSISIDAQQRRARALSASSAMTSAVSVCSER